MAKPFRSTKVVKADGSFDDSRKDALTACAMASLDSYCAAEMKILNIVLPLTFCFPKIAAQRKRQLLRSFLRQSAIMKPFERVVWVLSKRAMQIRKS